MSTTSGSNQRVVGLKSRQLNDLTNEICQPRRLHTHPRLRTCERRQGRRPHPRPLRPAGNRPDGSLEFVADVGDESRVGSPRSAEQPLSRRPVRESGSRRGRDASRCEVGGGDARPRLDLEVDHATVPSAPDAADQLQQLGYGNPTATVPDRGSWRSRLPSSTSSCGPTTTPEEVQHRQHLGRHQLEPRARRRRKSDLALSSCPNGDPRQDHTDPQPDNKRHDSDPERVHTKIVGVGRGAL